ncbi:hypothetical protein [Winogradskyella luteola]|uniref:V-type ATP synthase subunit E n=1 Tax=Winogradskyella luteola TaxID=2828330 RepID=A0A9X1FBF7_9FLAO|nr:hypothetical protein [Winogradskyella luteola]MBV7270629.1 hypothetical protein [Winogradskyella luteola]
MSENTLDKLITKLKLEAIDAAESEANDTIESAKTKARSILSEAQAKSDELIETAEIEAKTIIIKAEGALKQAARDLSLSLRNDLLNLLGNVLDKEVKITFTADLMETAVLKVVENIGSGVALKLPKGLEKNVANQIQKRLQESSDITSVTSDNSLVNAFSITKIDEGWSYDISPEEISNLLKKYLSQKWVYILNTDS